jgi:hypothetical protein
MNVSDDLEEDFNPAEWDIRREGRKWTREEVDKRLYQASEKIEFAGGIFTSDEERMTVLAMLLENLGIDVAVKLGNPADGKRQWQRWS